MSVYYIFSCISPWAYLGHDKILDITSKHNVELLYRPISLLKLFEQTGGKPLAQRPISRQNYRMLELQRWREARNIPLNLHPTFWPFNPSLVDRTVIAAVEMGHPVAGFVKGCMRGVWNENLDLADRDQIYEVAQKAGLPAGDCLDRAEQDDICALYETYTQEAYDFGTFGSPTYVLGGEVFWGQDRLDLLEAAIVSGREPYQVL